jgi:nicotinamide phosphoribosyltransferase
MNINPLLLCDFYKMVHRDCLPKGITKSVSYYTPRMSRIKGWDTVPFFGLQAFIKTYLIDYFNTNFFNRDIDEVVYEYHYYAEHSLGKGVVDANPIARLHELGYLPVEIAALPEGTKVPMGIPCFGITNTHPDFAWLPQALESLISAELWYPMICAQVGVTYREIVDKYYDETCDDNLDRARALGNFDFRGDQSLDAALKAASGWMLSFKNTATVPSIPYMEKMYNCDVTKEDVGFGAVSMEHFVTCSNYAIDGDERTFIKRLLTEIYPETSFSFVADSYDYWNVVENIIPSLKEEILNHKGCILLRGDSGDPVEVVTKTVFKLWDIFGGSVNSKGYKVLDPHVKAIYGDSITQERCRQIYEVLKSNGFAACNVSLGVGSFSMHCLVQGNDIQVFTRDSYGVAIKACYAEFTDEHGNMIYKSIYKDPKTDRETGHGFKKSHKGCCIVTRNSDGNLICEDDYYFWEGTHSSPNLLLPIFKDGKFIKETSLSEIRNRLHNNKF